MAVDPSEDRAPSGTQTTAQTGERTVTVDLSGPPSVVETITAGSGSVPRIRLEDTGPGTEAPGQPTAPGNFSDRRTRLRVLGEIARGGMGAVLRGRDEDLGRELAIKVLLEHHQDDAAFRRRFLEEAQIGGQLQHPGIVPIYELGTFADSRPYFAMKLVHGETLSALLAARPDPADGLPPSWASSSRSARRWHMGELDRVDERADVFALGSILCEILTGRPAYIGDTVWNVLDVRASRPGRRGSALNNCGEEPELISAGSDSYV